MDPRMNSLFIEDAELVGVETSKAHLIGWSIGGDARCSVNSVVGMGGLEKTTLAKKVFDSPENLQNGLSCVLSSRCLSHTRITKY